MAKEENGKEKILAAIRRAAADLGRAPSRGEMRRITGVSHYRVLAVFPTLREAVRAAGLEPNPKGEKISTEDLLSDWKRVAEKLGRRPSRAEYVREGKYSAGAFVGRFGSWGNISTTEDTEKHRGLKGRKAKATERANHKGHKETQRKERSGHLVIGTSGDRRAEASRVLSGAELHSHKRNERRQNNGESVLRNFDRVPGAPGDRKNSAAIRVPRRLTKPKEWKQEETQRLSRDFDRVPLAAVPSPLVGMRRVTESVAQMVVNTLMGSGYWPLAIGQKQNREFNHPFDRLRAGYGHEGTQREIGTDLGTRDFADRTVFEHRGIMKDRPVMGEPFDRRPMTNAPVNELGVMVLFGMVAAGLGLQVESVQGKFPDCIARRQVAPGKWQYLRIEFEYESKNFKLHGHDPKGCDVIVCWKHNWKECPDTIEVIELCRLIG
ncbi:MAG: hypothetical protein WCG81_14595 [Candidatus Angelobacter sp.]